MKKLIFFDTETTGRDADDRLCQLAYKTGEESFCELYNPGKKIPPDASAVHHISNKMVASKPAFTESKEYKRIKKLFEDKNNILIAHNAIFDVEMLKKEDINIPNFICTLRVARHLDKEGKIEKYNLQYLRYFLDIEVEAAAHDAMGDVVVMEKLFERLKDRMMAPTEIGVPTEVGKELTEEEVLEKMMDISSRPSLMRSFNFGKHVGKKLEEVLASDRGYLEWLLVQKTSSGQNEEDWIYTLKYHLNKK